MDNNIGIADKLSCFLLLMDVASIQHINNWKMLYFKSVLHMKKVYKEIKLVQIRKREFIAC